MSIEQSNQDVRSVSSRSIYILTHIVTLVIGNRPNWIFFRIISNSQSAIDPIKVLDCMVFSTPFSPTISTQEQGESLNIL